MAVIKLARAASSLRSGIKFLTGSREKSFVMNRTLAREMSRARFADALRAGFPNSPDVQVARQWAKVLGRSERQIQNWLAGDSSAGVEDVYAVCASLGVFKTMEIMTRDRTRNSILGDISQ
jgi:hypothetical protein